MSKGRIFITLCALGAAGGSIYIIPYIKYVFYDQQLNVMGISNAQSGLLLTVFAITAIVLFIPGGLMADKFNSKKLIIVSLLGTTILTFIYAFTLSYHLSLVIWAGLGVTTATTFWSGFIKTIDFIGEEKDSGKVFGIYYAMNGIFAAIINSIALKVSTVASTEKAGFFAALIVIGASTLISAVLVVIFLDQSKVQEEIDRRASNETGVTLNDDSFKLGDIKEVMKMPSVYALALLDFVAYSLYSSASYFTPYLTDVIGLTPSESGVYAIIRTYLFMLLAPIGGLMCDKILKKSARWFMIAWTVVAVLIFGVTKIPGDASATFASIYTLLPAAFTMAVYGVCFSIIRELHIPAKVLGTAIGLASIFAWLPDLFMHTMFGVWLDKYGNGGYSRIFIYLIIIAVVGILVSFLVRRKDAHYSADQQLS
ncbi:MAG: MFS transporter [Eubacteriaceae bacterium]|jgi:nitrate/nitrite transporter NarK|nr:MFS transporter [Eubacteriaceae bacterium]